MSRCVCACVRVCAVCVHVCAVCVCVCVCVCVVCVCVCVCVYVMHLSYMSSEHAALSGLSNLCPFFKSLGRVTGSTPGYGILPPVKSSQHVTPYDHYTDDMAKGMLVRPTVLWVSCMGKNFCKLLDEPSYRPY